MGGAIWDFVSTGITEKIIELTDSSENNVGVNVMDRARIVPGLDGKGIDLNGHDQWLEVYRDKALGISGNNPAACRQHFFLPPCSVFSNSSVLAEKPSIH